MRKNETSGPPLRCPSNLCAVSLCGSSSLWMMWVMVSSRSLAGQTLDERPGYSPLAGQGRVNAVRSLEFWIRGQTENRLQVHDGVFLLLDELCYGQHVRVVPVRLPHLERRVGGGPFLVESRRRDPDPPRARQRGGDPPHGLQVLDGLLQADLRLVRLGSYPGHVVAAKKTDHPVGFLGDNGRDEAAQGHRGGLGGYSLVDDEDAVLRAPQTEQVTQDLQPGLQVVGDAVADAKHNIPRPKRQPVDATGETILFEEFARGPASVLVETDLRVLVSRFVQTEERRCRRVAHAGKVSVRLLQVR